MKGVCVFAAWALCLSTLLSGVSAAQSGSAQPLPTATIRLEINGQEQIKQAVFNALVEQFRKLESVQLVEANAMWTIKIETVPVPDASGGVAAIGLSEIVLENRPYVQWLRILATAWHYLLSAGLLQQDRPVEQSMRQLAGIIDSLPPTADATTVKTHNMCVVAVGQLDQVYRDIVSDFNAKALRPYRASQTSGSAGTDKPATASSAPAAPAK